MKRVWVAAVVLACTLVGSVRAERVLVDSDFAGKELPKGWTDNASADAQARYQSVKADDGATATRITPLRGQVRLSCPLPRDAADHDAFYRLSIQGRSVTRGVVQLALRPADVAGDSRKLSWSARRELLEVESNPTALFQLPKQATPLALSVTLPADGSVDLAHVRLVEMTRDELVARMKQDAPKGGTRQNLLRVSRFPQGVESGGAVGRERSDEQYEIGGDPGAIGPSGAPALGLKCDQGMRFLLPPVAIPWTFTKHTASVYVRGHGSGSLSVLADAAPVASQPFSVDSDAQWTRVTLTFDPALLAREHQLVLDVRGTVRADAFQLEPGAKATDYVERPEVSLGLPDTDASVERIQFDDDPAVVNFVATGIESGTLNAKVVDVYGNQRRLPDIPLATGSVVRGSIGYAVFGHSYGPFRLEAWVEDENGRATSPVNEIVITRVPRPRAWDEDAPDSPFGVHLGPVHRQMVLAKAVGINWARLHDAGVDATAWSYLEPTKGQWQWRDDEIDRYRDHHLCLLGTLQTSPGWASGLGRAADGYWDRYLQPTDPAAWDNYVRQTVNHYKDDIQAWDVWNEPWLKFWSTWDPATQRAVRSPTAAADYAALERSTYKAVNDVFPDATVLGLNSTGGSHGRSWTRDVADAGGLAPCDAYSYHSYTNETAGFPGDVVERHFHDALDPAIAALKPYPSTAPATSPSLATSNPQLATPLDKPVWLTEGSGTNLAITRGFYHYSAPGEDPEDVVAVADRLARWEVSTLAQGVAKIFLYHINVGGEFRPGPGSFVSLVTDDGYPDPSAAAHAVLAWHVEGKRFVKRVEVARGVYAAIFAGETRSVAVLTSAPTHDKYALPHDVIALDLRDLFGNDLPGGSDYDGHTTYVDLQGSESELETVLHHGGAHRAAVTTRPAK